MGSNMPIDELLSQFDFIVLAPNAWQSQRMNRQQIFSRVAKYSHVVYSVGLKYNWELASMAEAFLKPFSRIQKIDSIMVDLPSSLLVRIKKFKTYDSYVLSKHAKSLQKRITSNNKVVLYIFHPHYRDYVDHIDYDILVYHPYDDFSKQGEGGQSLQQDEQYLIEKSDLVITPSAGVTENLKSKYLRNDINTVHNGVDFSAFAKFAGPSIYNQQETKFRVAYVGSINIKVNIDILLWLSEEFPEVNVELIGPIGNLGHKKEAFEQLKNKSNVILHGSKHFSELPEIISKMHCLLMCYDTSPTLWAGLAYPLKLNEYLAVKVPVISCELPSVSELSSIVDVACSVEDWTKSLRNIIAGKYNKQDKGFVYAKRQDWNSRVEQIAHLIDAINDEN